MGFLTFLGKVNSFSNLDLIFYFFLFSVKPVIVSFLASLTVSEGSPVSLPCRAVGDFPVKHTWIRTASIQNSPEQSGSNSLVSLPQQIHIDGLLHIGQIVVLPYDAGFPL